ncbi:MAG: hypothetical protein ABL959_21810 [Pyrinomonadaceae bacterium]
MNESVEVDVHNKRRFWPPFIVFLLLTPFALLAGFISGGAGHGDYFVAKFLFPYTMLSTIPFGYITDFFLIFALVQFPLYGFVLGMINQRARLIPPLIAILLLHTSVALLCIYLLNVWPNSFAR